MVNNQSVKSHKTFPPWSNLHYTVFASVYLDLFMKTLQLLSLLQSSIVARYVLVNHKEVGFQKNSETCPKNFLSKRKITQSSSPVQCSIPVVHSTVYIYLLLHLLFLAGYIYSLDRTIGLDYWTWLHNWTELFSFFGQIPMLIFRKKPPLYKTDK